MIEFYNIKNIAVKHFYAWEDGEDFDWLRHNWSKFDLSTEDEAKEFIYASGYICSTYVHEAFFLKHTKEFQSVMDYCKFNGFTEEISNIIKDKLLWTIDLLLQVFEDEETLNEEFLHMTDEFEQAHPDGLKFLKYIAR